ncbi:MAG: D-alanine--D-alanine ligase [Clostridia bacterium]|nr:D-alanine--D-alanine ligase [Clostridia bacterium]
MPYREAGFVHRERVLVLKGGVSTEREISLRSGAAVAEALREAGYTAEELDLTADSVSELIAKKPDLVFLALHGKGGEDGSVQGLLEWLGLPYTGPGVAASALCMDKLLTKKCLAASGVATAPFRALSPGDGEEAALAAAEELGLPLVLKACRQGSSIGTVIARTKDAVPAAWREAASYGDDVVAEAFLSGTELTVPVLGGKEPEALPVIEITSEGAFYDFASKYTPGGSRHIIPARIPEKTRAAVEELALNAYKATGCRGFARVDVMLSGEGEPFVLEINTIPGMTAQSLLPDAGRAVGLSFPALAEKIVMTALRERG